MRRIQLLLILFCLIPLGCKAQENFSLQFNDDHTFKIVQFTDLHADLDNPKHKTTITIMRKVFALKSLTLSS